MSGKVDKCTLHNGEPVTVYSVLHERCMCLKCAMVEHEHLTDFIPISEGAKRVRKDGKAILDEIKALSETTKQIKASNKEDWNKAIASEKKIKANLRKIRDQIIRKLDLLEQKVINRVQLIWDKGSKSYHTNQHGLASLQADLKKMNDRLTKTLSSATDTDVIRAVVEEKRLLSEKKHKVREQEDKPSNRSIELNISPAVQEFIDKVDELGEVIVGGLHQGGFVKRSIGFIKPKASSETLSFTSVREDEASSPYNISPGRLSNNRYGIRVRDVHRPYLDPEPEETLIDFLSDEEYMIKTGLILLSAKHETPCSITGITALSSGRVVLCDAKHKSIQLLNRRSKVIDYLRCRNKPCDVDSISDHSVVISFYEKDYISIFNVSDYRFIHVRDIVISGRGGSYSVSHDQDKFAVCRRGEIKIVSAETGRLLNTVEIDFHFPKIKMSDSKLYLSDFVGGKVTCMTELGKVRWEYGQDKFETSSLALDLNKLFVSDIKGVVFILSTYGVMLKEIACPGHLNVLCVDSWTGTILIAQESRDRTKSRELKIIQL